jgi:hypothetical protein
VLARIVYPAVIGICLSMTEEIAEGPLVACNTIVDHAESSLADVLGRLAAIAEAFERVYY